MKIIDAVWEVRNLGISVTEIEVGANDTYQELVHEIINDYSDYTVLKVPTSRSDLLFPIAQHQFIFVEMSIKCAFEGKTPKLSSLRERYLKNLSIQTMSQEEIAETKNEIKNKMFISDRIAIDPFFSLERSANRYIGWIDDELNKGGFIYSLRFKNINVGFFICRMVDNDFICSLGGIFPKFQGIGLGYFLNYFEILTGFENGAKRIITTYSSNNLDSQSIHLDLGYKIISQFYVFVKHRTHS